jgi:hypothetical protein
VAIGKGRVLQAPGLFVYLMCGERTFTFALDRGANEILPFFHIERRFPLEPRQQR